MANTNAPSGLRAVRHFAGGIVRLSEHTIADGYNTAIYFGDMVKHTGTGRNIAVCAAGDLSCGVFAGCRYVALNGEIKFSPNWVASTALMTGTLATAMVYDDPMTVFEVQASASLVATDIGNIADMTAATAGNATTGVSGQQLDTTTLAATGSAQFKVLELVNRPDNAYGTNAKVLVLINEHEYRAAMTAV